MPNHCKNVLKIRCSDEALLKEIKAELIHVRKYRDGDSTEFTMTNFMPVPEDYDTWDNETCIKWCEDNWGTKWDCYHTEVKHDTPPTELEVFYMTAWSPNWAFLCKHINEKLLGKVDFIEFYYYEFRSDFSGYYKYEDGKEIQEHFDTEDEIEKFFPPLTEEEIKEREAQHKAKLKDMKENPQNWTII